MLSALSGSRASREIEQSLGGTVSSTVVVDYDERMPTLHCLRRLLEGKWLLPEGNFTIPEFDQRSIVCPRESAHRCSTRKLGRRHTGRGMLVWHANGC